MDFILNLVIFAFSIILHEVAHAYSAYLCGDPTAKDEGRITLNPIPHIDLWWSIIMPLLFFFSFGKFFGGAKPVPINPLRFYNRRLGITIVSAAGPLINITLALIAGLLINLLLYFNIVNLLIYKICIITIIYNFLLAFFNLLPIPPLDGSKIPIYFLPSEYEDFIYRTQFIGIFILLIFLNLGGASIIINLLNFAISQILPIQTLMILHLLL
ncbi:MAG TPA: site-2 protease family protein [bacterium]|nr:site-2 protease family protein [bacterium]